METAVVPLSQGKRALIDPGRLAEVTAAGPWHVAEVSPGRFYARAKIDGALVYLHRFLAGPRDDQEVDHRNGDGLDNRSHNLRVCTHAQNQGNQRRPRNNTSGFKGVYRHPNRPAHRCWQAKTYHLGRQRSHGYYGTAEDAARAYDRAAIELWGEFAALNFPRAAV